MVVEMQKERTYHRSAQGNVTAKVDVPSDRQVIEINNMWYLLETFLELMDLKPHLFTADCYEIKTARRTFLKCSPSLITGVVPNIRSSFIVKRPFSMT